MTGRRDGKVFHNTPLRMMLLDILQDKQQKCERNRPYQLRVTLSKNMNFGFYYCKLAEQCG